MRKPLRLGRGLLLLVALQQNDFVICAIFTAPVFPVVAGRAGKLQGDFVAPAFDRKDNCLVPGCGIRPELNQNFVASFNSSTLTTFAMVFSYWAAPRGRIGSMSCKQMVG